MQKSSHGITDIFLCETHGQSISTDQDDYQGI